MTRRGFLAALLAVVAADLTGARRQERADRRCRVVGRAFQRNHGISASEQRVLDRLHCREVDGEWVSADSYQA